MSLWNCLLILLRIYLCNTVACNYRKKIGFPVCKKLINLLVFEDPRLLYWTATKQQLGVAQKGEVGDKVLHWNLKVNPCTPGFLWAKENLPPGWYTHRYGGGSWACSQCRLWPFLGKYGRCKDRYRGGSWAPSQGRLWPIVSLPRAKLYVHSRST